MNKELRDDPLLAGVKEVAGGKQLGRCVLTRKLGQGGMGAVYAGKHTALDIEVAVKVLPSTLAERDPSFIKRFLQEAQTAARINHPNIIRVLDVDKENQLHFLIMEFVDGESVMKILEREKVFPEERALQIITEAALALEEAHANHIIHRDIKPDNLMVTKTGRVKVADLGLAKKLDQGGDSGLTATSSAMGTPHYMSPEQATDAKSADHRTDIYSLGITLYHMVVGEVPYHGTTLYQVLSQVVNKPLPNPKEKRPGLSEELCAILYKMTKKNPCDRYESCTALLGDLRKLQMLREEGRLGTPEGRALGMGADPYARTVAAAPGSGVQPGFSSRKGMVLGAMAATAIAAVAVTLFVLLSSRNKTDGPVTPQPPTAVTRTAPTATVSTAIPGGPVWSAPEEKNGLDMVFCRVEGGVFRLGSEAEERKWAADTYGWALTGLADEIPVRQVRLSSFYLAKHEVSNRLFARFLREKHYLSRRGAKPDQFLATWRDGKPPEDREQHPVVFVSWHDAVAFAEWVTEYEMLLGKLPEGHEYRLPTEAEWECAASYDSKSDRNFVFPWGDQWEANKAQGAELLADRALDKSGWAQWYKTARRLVARTRAVPTVPVDALPGTASTCGALNLAGNVWEWCWDYYNPDAYKEDLPDDPRGPAHGTERVIRGGGWANVGVFLRTAGRGRLAPESTAADVGFRLVLASRKKK